MLNRGYNRQLRGTFGDRSLGTMGAQGFRPRLACAVPSALGVLLLMILSLLPTGVCVAGETATLRNGFSIHYVRRQNLGETTRLFLSDSADSFVDVPTDDIQDVEQDSPPAVSAPKSAPKPGSHKLDLDQALSAASIHNNLSPELVRSVVKAESGFNPNARSGKGAQGLMQLMPQTAWQMGVRDAFDPVENLEGGSRYLSELLYRYNNDLPIALAAYNAGPQRVEQYHGIPPFPETINYVNRVLKNLNQEGATGRKTNSSKSTHNSKKRAPERARAIPAAAPPEATAENMQGN